MGGDGDGDSAIDVPRPEEERETEVSKKKDLQEQLKVIFEVKISVNELTITFCVLLVVEQRSGIGQRR